MVIPFIYYTSAIMHIACFTFRFNIILRDVMLFIMRNKILQGVYKIFKLLHKRNIKIQRKITEEH